MMKQLNNPLQVQLYDVFQSPNKLYLVMEL